MLSERIRQFRTAMGINQVQLAGAIGVSKQCISNWENDNIQPSVEMLVTLAGFFNTTCDCLIGLDNKKYIEVSDLTDEQIAHINLIIDDIRK